ncbi:MAG: hypothetical protein Q8P93_04750 [bacterium]|nr:hypothetical protein [bacterium]
MHSGKEWTYTPLFIEKRIEYFAEKFKDIDADILLLQEVASEDMIQRIISRCAIPYKYFFATPANNVGNVVLYKDEDAVCGTIPAKTVLPVFVEGDCDVLGERMWSRRDFVYIKSTYNNKPLYCIGIHIKANFMVALKTIEGENYPIETQLDGADSVIRSEYFRFSQAKKVREVVGGILKEDPDAYVMVGGDFNAPEFNSVFRIIRGAHKDEPDALLSAVTQNTHAGGHFLVDHLLFSKSMEAMVDRVQVLDGDLVDHKHTPDNIWYPGSDHPPVVLDLFMSCDNK